MSNQELELSISRLCRSVDLFLDGLKYKFQSLGVYNINFKEIYGFENMNKTIMEIIKSIYNERGRTA
jgi:hypothetical protein